MTWQNITATIHGTRWPRPNRAKFLHWLVLGLIVLFVLIAAAQVANAKPYRAHMPHLRTYSARTNKHHGGKHG